MENNEKNHKMLFNRQVKNKWKGVLPMDGSMNLYQSLDIVTLVKKAQRKDTLWITTETLWVVGIINCDEKQETLMIMEGGQVFISSQTVKQVINSSKKDGFTREVLWNVFEKAGGKKLIKFPIIATDMIFGTLDGTCRQDNVWFNFLKIRHAEKSRHDPSGLTLIEMSDHSQWLVQKSQRRLNDYFKEICQVYRTYIGVMSKRVSCFNKELQIENKFRLDVPRKIWETVQREPLRFSVDLVELLMLKEYVALLGYKLEPLEKAKIKISEENQERTGNHGKKRSKTLEKDENQMRNR